VPFTTERLGRTAAAELGAALDAWTPATWAGQLHVGDLGWQLRFEDDLVDGSLLAVRDAAGTVCAVGLLDDPRALRVAIDPARADDVALAVAVADAAECVLPAGEAYVDGLPLAGWRAVLADRGWSADPDTWVALHRSLDGIAPELPSGVAPLAGDADVADRVAVQRGAFDNSTFTTARWALMAGGPAYDGRLDLLARDAEGRPVAAGTGWAAGPGRCAILEPVGTHRDHQRQGHGGRLLAGLCAALAAAGARSVAVQTPSSNEGAVQAYTRAGFSVLGLLTAMRRPPAS
jgi:ribosomal protein S18 acetylase RimI-like enzyme